MLESRFSGTISNDMTVKKNRILFRTSGGKAPKKQLGMGHVFRCINLAKTFKDEEIFFLVEDYGTVRDILLKNHFENIIVLKKNIDIETDILLTLDIIRSKKIDVVLIDKFKVKSRFVSKVGSITKTVVISDLNKIDYNCDLIVNGFIGFKNQHLMNKFRKKCLLGPKYQILDDKFAKNKKQITPIFDLIVTVGGFDESKIIVMILKTLKKFKEKIKSKIILGPATKSSHVIKKLEKELGSSVKILQQTTNMKKEISSARFGICSGGITTYEFATMNKAFAIISQVKHQTKTAKIWNELGIATDLGIASSTTPKKIEAFIEKNISNSNYMKRKQNMVDGRGSFRVQKEILKLIKEKKD